MLPPMNLKLKKEFNKPNESILSSHKPPASLPTQLKESYVNDCFLKDFCIMVSFVRFEFSGKIT